jgi:hypothetical protein
MCNLYFDISQLINETNYIYIILCITISYILVKGNFIDGKRNGNGILRYAQGG